MALNNEVPALYCVWQRRTCFGCSLQTPHSKLSTPELETPRAEEREGNCTTARCGVPAVHAIRGAPAPPGGIRLSRSPNGTVLAEELPETGTASRQPRGRRHKVALRKLDLDVVVAPFLYLLGIRPVAAHLWHITIPCVEAMQSIHGLRANLAKRRLRLLVAQLVAKVAQKDADRRPPRSTAGRSEGDGAVLEGHANQRVVFQILVLGAAWVLALHNAKLH
mmetsp:Transcript_104282/g.326259  ORF Transcript_104282/g.326259 Transcript_104282/m.326259 type:complete len:221 (+) Transcript_104282:226-888(+)